MSEQRKGGEGWDTGQGIGFRTGNWSGTWDVMALHCPMSWQLKWSQVAGDGLTKYGKERWRKRGQRA